MVERAWAGVVPGAGPAGVRVLVGVLVVWVRVGGGAGVLEGAVGIVEAGVGAGVLARGGGVMAAGGAEGLDGLVVLFLVQPGGGSKDQARRGLTG